MMIMWYVTNTQGESEYMGSYAECMQYINEQLEAAEQNQSYMVYLFDNYQAEFFKVQKTLLRMA